MRRRRCIRGFVVGSRERCMRRAGDGFGEVGRGGVRSSAFIVFEFRFCWRLVGGF